MGKFKLLSERLEWAIQAKEKELGRRIFNAELAGIAKVSRAAVTNWMKDINGIAAEYARLIGNFLGVDPIWLESGEGKPISDNAPLSRQRMPSEIFVEDDEDSEFVGIKRVDLKISAGVSGYAVDYLDGERSPIFFRRDWLQRKGYDAGKLFAFAVNGQSMEPSLFEGDLVVINANDSTPVDGEVFAANYEGELVIKRLIREAGMWYLASDNPDKRRYPNKLCHENCFIIGRIIYKQSERI